MEASRGASHVYGIERHTLCLASVAGDSLRSRFALGTLGITEPSEIHLVDFDSDENALSSVVYKHSRGIRALASATWAADQLLVVHNAPAAPPAELVRLAHVPDDLASTQDAVEQSTAVVATLDSPSAEPQPHAAVCHPASYCQTAAIVSASSVRVWEFAQAAPAQTHAILAPRNAMDDIEALAWHPAAAAQLSTADGMCVRSWDMRADPRSQQTMAIEYAHSGKCRALDYNPNLPYILATAGDDGSVRLWDARCPAAPLMEIANHTHWIYSVAFNPNHDQLLLSAGADGLVNLESAVSASSARVVAGMGESSGLESDAEDQAASVRSQDDVLEKPNDGLVAQYDDHETSVYAARWSNADPWVFASLSFDGRLVINTVPQEEKYKILL
ncbi:phosphatidylserine decarboxylase 1 [Coemansia erecta]|nr:phosphatidylserine decarboxylase 1 [Coemansia sp. RSA 2618]KAJ2828237.1 phosphatidylserine decarboxylase 1 [Coemansia erecta]